jgi:hypothetical protein
MGKKPEKKELDPAEMLFVIGLDEKGKPRGARFSKCDDRIVSAALDLLLTAVHPASAAFVELGMKLPEGRLYASGKTFIPNVRRDLLDKLNAVLATPGDESKPYKLARPPGQTPEDQDSGGTKVATVSPISSGLPRSWESIGVGHVVLVHESPVDGWWEATVLKREDEMLTLRFRDYPKQPIFLRHISQTALINPGL